MRGDDDSIGRGRSTFVAATIAAVAAIAGALIALGGTVLPMFYRDYQWEMIKIGDCADIDEDHKETIGKVRGVPNADECNVNSRNKIAVCWDGATFTNTTTKIADASSKSWCAYKNVNMIICDGSKKKATGVIWECKERRMGSWADIRP